MMDSLFIVRVGYETIKRAQFFFNCYRRVYHIYLYYKINKAGRRSRLSAI